ncbi:MAG: phytoene desaturase family protein, partial [Actinomycetota bacterium]
MNDAVIVGSGPNGLVAANILADAGWDVIVLEAEPDPGGAVRSAEILPGHVYDRFSAFYPLAAVSPALRALSLEDHGLRWARAPLVVAHPFLDGRCAILSVDSLATAASVEAFSPGDGQAWLDLLERWRSVSAVIIDALLGPFPPTGAALRLLARSGLHEAIRTTRFALLPVRRMAEETFSGIGAAMLLGGNALHADLSPEESLSGLFGWMLASIGQQFGYPVPEGGSGALTAALVRRLASRGGRVECGRRVSGIEIRSGVASGVRTEDGGLLPARRAVLADVSAPSLYFQLVGRERLPSAFVDDLEHFAFDDATFKIDWVLDGPVPWTCVEAASAGTIHLARDMDHLTIVAAQLATGTIPADPYVIFGQSTVADPTRAPAGRHVTWAYTHVPQHVRGDAGGDLKGLWDASETQAFADRIETRIEAYAPGFRDRIVVRRITSPYDLEDADANLVNGALNGGTSALWQQLIFRPVPGLGRPETPIKNLYLASASAHPGGGVHGACGANAARAALAGDRRRRVTAPASAL